MMERGNHFMPDKKKRKLDLADLRRQKLPCSNPHRGPLSHATDKLHEAVERAIHAHYEQWRVASG